MPENQDNSDSRTEYAGPSKSALKRQMTALQQIGESLVELSDRELGRIPIDDERLLTAIRETQRIKSNNARRRHMQFLGKLMRDIDAEPITAALAQLHAERKGLNAAFHALEELRDQVLERGLAGVELVMSRWPQGDRQQLRQLVLQHQREMKQGKPPAASRKLFGYLRELGEQEH